MFANARRELFELLAPCGMNFALPGLEVHVATLKRLGVQRRGDVVKQRELGLQALGNLRGLVDRGQGARGGVLDGNQDASDRLHGARAWRMHFCDASGKSLMEVSAIAYCPRPRGRIARGSAAIRATPPPAVERRGAGG